MKEKDKKPTIAIVCANGLGDALVQMVLAQNLSEQAIDITFFSDMAASLDRLVNSYKIKKFPDITKLLSTLQAFDLVLYDSSGKYVREMPSEVEQWCKDHAVCFRMSDAPPRHTQITTEQISQQLPSSSLLSANQFKSLNASLRGKYCTLYRPPVVDQLCEHLRSVTRLSPVTTANGLPQQTNLNAKKILIHPTSSNSKKNWPVDHYIKLVKTLASRGFEPFVTVAPHERDEWIANLHYEMASKSPQELDSMVPLFPTILALAEFYTDARYFIGNDSGNGHLASALCVPTIQIFSGWKTSPAWRAGWANNEVITPRFPFNFVKRHWQRGVSVQRVLSVLENKLDFEKEPL